MSVDPLIGEELEHYRLDKVLGRGGMGVVYAGTDMALKRPVAVKVLPPHLLDDQTARARFQREIESAVAIEHPHVVPIYAAGYDKRHFFLVMRMVQGPDLAQELRRCGAVSESRALRLLGQIASALHAVHASQLVHRDVKPQNVLVGACGDPDEHALLTDFGIAKALTDSVGLTGMGPIGTPMYMAPEVCSGQRASPASDQYSLAVMAYEMLAARPPFLPEDGDVMDAHVSRAPEALASLAPQVSEPVCRAIERGLEKRPESRFSDVRELVAVDARSRISFEEAEHLTDVLNREDSPEELVLILSQEHRLSDHVVAAVTDIPFATVARVRRRAAREALVGPSEKSRGRRGDATKKTST